MLKALIVGLMKGLMVGGVLAVLLTTGLGITTFGPWLGALGAALLGVAVGLLAGNPVWARGAGIEAGLKALAGAVVAVLALFALRRWFDLPLDLSALGLPKGTLGTVPALALPLIGSALSVVFEIDHRVGGGETRAEVPAPKARVEASEMPPEPAHEEIEPASEKRRERS